MSHVGKYGTLNNYLPFALRFSQALDPARAPTIPEMARAIPEISTPWYIPRLVKHAIPKTATNVLLQSKIFFIKSPLG